MKQLPWFAFSLLLGPALLLWPNAAAAQERIDSQKLAEQLRTLDARVLATDAEKAQAARRMLNEDVRKRLQEVNRRETQAWRQVNSAADWEAFRKPRQEALLRSLGPMPPVPHDLHLQVTRRLQGEGYQIENLVFESRPGVRVTANLYLPDPPRKDMPAILIIHSHHNPKTQGELQDMGMTWARDGCAVLIMDQLGHGERRQHPFVNAQSYGKPYRSDRQDYHFRYNTAMQLHLTGQSLMGWMVWDLMRGVDLLAARPDVDCKRIILLGSVAGGGDPAAVTAALDKRIAAVAPFNFGGPQPESRFPLPADPDESFNFAGSGSWESTRNLRLSARDGFLPWFIVASAAPRALIYAHEFSWDQEHDPVWRRLQEIYKWYHHPERLDSAHGRGKVTGKPPESTHCNNIGPVHRKQIYPALQRWFNIPIPAAEYRKRRPSDELLCLTAEGKDRQQPLWKLTHDLGAQQAADARAALSKVPPAEQRKRLRQVWDQRLGGTLPVKLPGPLTYRETSQLGEVLVMDWALGPITVKRMVLNTERAIQVPLMLLKPAVRPGKRMPVVVAFAQAGHAGFLKNRSADLAKLLSRGVAVCLPDLRGTGETQPGEGRRPSSAASSVSATELMLGGTIRGGQCRDLVAVLDFLRRQADLDGDRIALWGDSFVPVNAPERDLVVPYLANDLPDMAEPMGSQVALLGALLDERIVAVRAEGGLAGNLSVLESPFCYVPHDAAIPGALAAGDVCDLVGALAPRPVYLGRLVNGRNQNVSGDVLRTTFAPTVDSYRRAGGAKSFQVTEQVRQGASPAHWLLEQLGKAQPRAKDH
jgi:cephalosporin-C deacetylase-like acetyl esterase